VRTFSDKAGQQWTLDLTFGCLSRIKGTLGHDLLRPEKKITHEDLGETSLQAAVMLDFPLFLDVLYVAVQPMCEQRNITSAQFGELMAPACVIDARDKFREEWRDFFLGLQRPDQAMALEKMGIWLKAAHRKIDQAMMAEELEKLDEQVNRAMDLSLKRSFGNLRESLASIQERSPGGSFT
jgi:hypothetical protein